MAWLLYGQLADGELLHISEAARGDACGCYCPHCQTPLAAKKGKVKVHHFAHLGQTCAYVSVYDFLHIDHYVDTTLGLTQWANWKQDDMVQTGIRLKAEDEQFSQEMAQLLAVINEDREVLAEISQPHPNRKQRSKVRQANFEVLQQWDAYIADHNAPLPDIERVRDLEPTSYRALYFIREGRWGGHYTTGRSAWPNELWFEENKTQDWIPGWLAKGGLAILNEYGPLRRKLATAELHREAFEAEKTRFERFHLYFLLVEFENRPPLFKVGITSRVDLTERMREIRQDLHTYSVTNVSVLTELSGHAYLESYFKHKYARQQTRLGKLTEYFAFDEDQLAHILDELTQLSPKGSDRSRSIKGGMVAARQQGIHVGRPQGLEADERFRQKAKSRQVAALIAEHPDWSLRAIARQSGVALNTVCKVAKLVAHEVVANFAPDGTRDGCTDPLPSTEISSTVDTVEALQGRHRVVEALQQADDYLVITVSKSDEQGQRPIGMHLSRLEAIGPALATLMQQDQDFYEAMGELVADARRHRCS